MHENGRTALDASLSDLESCWLELRCCKGLTHYPLRLLAKQRGGDLLLRDVLRWLRCERCGSAPSGVALVETILTDGKGRNASWRIDIGSASLTKPK